MSFTEITTEAELREAIGGYAKGRAATKVRPKLHPLQIEWLKASPFCVIATSDAAGNCDASPIITWADNVPTTRCKRRLWLTKRICDWSIKKCSGKTAHTFLPSPRR